MELLQMKLTYLAETAAALTVEHPDYSYLAGRIGKVSVKTPGFIIATKNLFEDSLLRRVLPEAMAHLRILKKLLTTMTTTYLTTLL